MFKPLDIPIERSVFLDGDLKLQERMKQLYFLGYGLLSALVEAFTTNSSLSRFLFAAALFENFLYLISGGDAGDA